MDSRFRGNDVISARHVTFTLAVAVWPSFPRKRESISVSESRNLSSDEYPAEFRKSILRTVQGDEPASRRRRRVSGLATSLKTEGPADAQGVVDGRASPNPLSHEPEFPIPTSPNPTSKGTCAAFRRWIHCRSIAFSKMRQGRGRSVARRGSGECRPPLRRADRRRVPVTSVDEHGGSPDGETFHSHGLMPEPRPAWTAPTARRRPPGRAGGDASRRCWAPARSPGERRSAAGARSGVHRAGACGGPAGAHRLVGRGRYRR